MLESELEFSEVLLLSVMLAQVINKPYSVFLLLLIDNFILICRPILLVPPPSPFQTVYKEADSILITLDLVPFPSLSPSSLPLPSLSFPSLSSPSFSSPFSFLLPLPLPEWCLTYCTKVSRMIHLIYLLQGSIKEMNHKNLTDVISVTKHLSVYR